MTDVARLRGERLTLGYGKYTVAENLTVKIPDGHFTAIIRANSCGKSTLLRTLSRLMTPAHGRRLDGGLSNITPVKRLCAGPAVGKTPPRREISPCREATVARGRYPHQPLVPPGEDEGVPAMRATGITPSGGSKAWIPSRWATPESVDRDGAGQETWYAAR